jgi:hypothetical protein
MKEIINKLVRDNIPEQIAANATDFKVKVLTDDQYYQELGAKLTEEVTREPVSAADGYDSYTGSEGGYDYSQEGSNDVGSDYG